MGRDTDFEFGWNEADNLAPPWRHRDSERASAGTGRRTAQQASAVPASEENWRDEETCEYVKKQIRLMTETVRKVNRMLPRSNAPSAPVREGGMNWLKTEMLSKQPKEAKILAVKASEGKFGPKVTLKLALNGQVVFDSITVKNNPNYIALEQKLGHDENDWINQKVLIGLEQDEFSDQFFKRYSFAPEPAKGKGK